VNEFDGMSDDPDGAGWWNGHAAGRRLMGAAGLAVATAAGRVSRVLRSMAVITGSDGVALMLADAPGRLRAVGGSNAEGLELEHVQELELFGPAYECVVAGRPVAVSDLREDTGAGHARLAARVAPVRAVLAIPVRINGSIAGSLNFYQFAPYVWSADYIAAVRHLADALTELLVRLARGTAAGAAEDPDDAY
jgi:GAF domain-containing protein